MALIDRVGTGLSNSISSHSFSAAVYLWSRGVLTRNQIVNAFSLSVDDQVQLDQLATFYGTLNNTEKGLFFGRLESLNILREEGYITTQEYKNLLGLT